MHSKMAERIIRSASELFSQNGYSGIRVDDIADFAGISKKTIYNHFPNKVFLVDAVIESNLQSLCTRIDQFDFNKKKELNWLNKTYVLIVFCCRELFVLIWPAAKLKNNQIVEKVHESSARIRRKIMEKAEQLFKEDMKIALYYDHKYQQALLTLAATVVEGIFQVNSLHTFDKIEQNPLICNLKTVAETYGNGDVDLPLNSAAGGGEYETAVPCSWGAESLFSMDGRQGKTWGGTLRGKRETNGKPTPEELNQRIKELEQKSVEGKREEDDLRKSKDRLSLAMEISEAFPWEINTQTCKWHCDPEDYETYRHESKEEFEKTIRIVESLLRYLKYTDDVLSDKGAFETPIHPDDRDKLFLAGKAVLCGEKSAYEGDHRMLGEDGQWVWYYGKAKITGWDKSGNPEILSGITIDITERKKVEQTLREREARLAKQTETLEETNTALKVLLKNRDEDKREFEEKIVTNLKEMVFPFMEKLKSSRLDEKQMVYLDIIKSHLEDMISPFLHRLSSKYSGLTPAEIKVAVFVKEGKTTKEIAELLNSSIDAVNFHRNNLRKKFGLVNSKTNLRTHLLSLS